MTRKNFLQHCQRLGVDSLNIAVLFTECLDNPFLPLLLPSPPEGTISNGIKMPSYPERTSEGQKKTIGLRGRPAFHPQMSLLPSAAPCQEKLHTTSTTTTLHPRFTTTTSLVGDVVNSEGVKT